MQKLDQRLRLGSSLIDLLIQLRGSAIDLFIDRLDAVSEQVKPRFHLLDGHLEGGTLTANVRRKDPADAGLTGTLIATVKGDKLDGEMKLAEANAAAVRGAKVTGTKGGK